MKKITRILSVALVALMVLSLTASAVAETPAVKIPAKLSRVKSADGVTVPTYDDVSGKFLWATVTTDVALMFDRAGNPIMSNWCTDRYTGLPVQAKGIDPEGCIYISISPAPDGVQVVWGEGVENLDEENGIYVTEREGHRKQPKGFIAYKNWEDGTTTTVHYNRDGSINYVDYTIPDVDFFQTGMEGAVATVRFRPVTVLTTCPKDETTDYYHYDWIVYVDQVNVDYPAGNEIVRVETDWRNDTKQALASYRISFATSETEVYQITFSPKSTTIFEDLYGVAAAAGIPTDGKYTEVDTAGGYCLIPSSGIPGTGVAFHSYYADEPIYGEYYKNGSLVAVTGSGDKINRWYKPGHGKEVKGLRPLSSFKSPRVK